MANTLIVAGLFFAMLVGVNIGGSSTAAAFGPSVGGKMITKALAAALMTVFVLLGGWTVGRNVVDTIGGKIVPRSTLTLEAAVVILLFIGIGLLVANRLGVPASTSMTTVSAIAGLGLATGTLQVETLSSIATWWVVSPLLVFVVAALIGRFRYAELEDRLGSDGAIDGPLVRVSTADWRPTVRLNADLGRQRLAVVGVTLAIGCYMAFSAGASNVANVVAPLVGNGALSMETGILLATATIGVGAFTIARRTLDTVGDGLGDLPLVAALVVGLLSATLITFLSSLGIPASLAIISTTSIIGLNWGRERRYADDGLLAGGATPNLADGGDVEEDLLDTDTTWRVLLLWSLLPAAMVVATYVTFEYLLA